MGNTVIILIPDLINPMLIPLVSKILLCTGQIISC